MISDLNGDTWRERWAAAIADPTISAEAEKIADDLPDDAQIAITYGEGPAWALVMTPIVQQQLLFFGLLDDDEASLTGLGIQVMRCLVRIDREYSRRSKEYADWRHAFFKDADRTDVPSGRAAGIAARGVMPGGEQALIDLATEGEKGLLVREDDHGNQRIVAALEVDGLVLVIGRFQRRQSTFSHVRITPLGIAVARMIYADNAACRRIMGAARQSAFWMQSDRDWCRAAERVIRDLGRLLAERPANPEAFDAR